MENKLYRSEDNKILLGICGGIGEYFKIDPVIIRIVLVVLIFAGFSGILAYFIAALIIPRRPVGMGPSGTGPSGTGSSGTDVGTIYEEYSSKFNSGDHNR